MKNLRIFSLNETKIKVPGLAPSGTQIFSIWQSKKKLENGISQKIPTGITLS